MTAKPARFDSEITAKFKSYAGTYAGAGMPFDGNIAQKTSPRKRAVHVAADDLQHATGFRFPGAP